MSVVNKMLKDLEQRGNQPIYEADYVPIESTRTKSKRFTVGVMVIIIMLSVATWFLIPTETSPTTTSNIEAEMQAVPDEQQALMTANTELAEKNAEDKFGDLSSQVVLSELDEATLSSLESAKLPDKIKAASVIETATDSQQETNKLSRVAAKSVQAQTLQTLDLEPEKSQALALTTVAVNAQAEAVEVNSVSLSPTLPAAFSVSSSTQSTSDNRMLEQQIQLSLKNGDTAEALKHLNNLVALEPRNSGARKRLASLEFAQNNPKRAAFLLDQGITLSPEDSSMRLMLARLLFRENRNDQALSLLAEHPQNVLVDNDLLSFRAALAEKQKDYTRSLQDYAKLLQRQPENARWMLGLAISQDKQKLHQEAVMSYKKVKLSNQLSAQVLSFVDGRLATLVGS